MKRNFCFAFFICINLIMSNITSFAKATPVVTETLISDSHPAENATQRHQILESLFMRPPEPALPEFNSLVTPPVNLYLQAIVKYEDALFIEAQTSFHQFIEEYPEHTFAEIARYMLCACAYALENYINALEQCENYRTTFPEGAYIGRIALISGQSYQMLNNYKQALAFYEHGTKHLAEFSEPEALLYHIGNLYAERVQDISKALFWFKRVTSEYPESWHSFNACWDEAECLVELGKPIEAVVAYDTIIARYANDNRSVALACKAAAVILRASGNNAGAALRCDIGLSTEYMPVREELLFLAAESYWDSSEQQKALGYYTKVVDEYPAGINTPAASDKIGENNGDTIYKQASLFYDNGQYSQASVQYATLLASCPYSLHLENARFYHGKSLVLAGDFACAEISLTGYFTQYPQGEWIMQANLLMSEVHEKLGKYNEAIEKCEHILNTWPNKTNKPELMYRIGRIYQTWLNNQQEALFWFDKCLAEPSDGLFGNPYKKTIPLDMAQCQAALGDFTKAKALIQSVIISNSSDKPLLAKSRLAMGNIIQLQEQFAQAFTWYNQVISANGLKVDAGHYEKAECYRKLSDVGEALKAYRAVIELHPASPYAPMAQKWLDELAPDAIEAKMAVAAFDKGDFTLGVKLADAYLEKKPASYHSAHMLALRADCLEAIKNWRLSVRSLEGFVGRYGLYMYSKAYGLNIFGEKDCAVPVPAGSGKPGNTWEPLENIGLSHLKYAHEQMYRIGHMNEKQMKEYGSAIAAYGQIIDMYNRDCGFVGKAYRHTAGCYTKWGKPLEALKAWKKYLAWLLDLRDHEQTGIESIKAEVESVKSEIQKVERSGNALSVTEKDGAQ